MVNQDDLLVTIVGANTGDVCRVPDGLDESYVCQSFDHLEADLEAKLKSAQAPRQSILRDAFEGKLVPQDPNDEPASELLKRIATEREERAKVATTEERGKARPEKREPYPPPARP